MTKWMAGGALVLSLTAFSGLSAHAAVLLHAYDFSVDASDSVGGLNGTLVGGATVVGGELVLPSNPSVVQLAGYAIPATDFSISLWVKGPAQSGYSEFISQNYSTNGFYIGTSPSNGIRLSDRYLTTGLTFPADNIYHHYALTTDGSGTNFYVDGVNVFSDPGTINFANSGTFTQFGQQFQGLGEQFIGSLDGIRIYSGALTASEVVQVMNSGTEAIPEPATLAFLGGGLAGIMALRRGSR